MVMWIICAVNGVLLAILVGVVFRLNRIEAEQHAVRNWIARQPYTDLTLDDTGRLFVKRRST